ncbi:MAG: hypothetical protein WD557_11925 [Dehalococcoidia bacterium]
MTRRNVTVSLDEHLARWVRVRAAECDTSVSQLMAEMLRREMEKDAQGDRERNQRAWEQFLSIPLPPLTKPGERYPTRDEIYDRHSVR